MESVQRNVTSSYNEYELLVRIKCPLQLLECYNQISVGRGREKGDNYTNKFFS